MTEVKSVVVEIPLVKKNEPTKIVTKIKKHIPLPPSYQGNAKTFDKKTEMEEEKMIQKVINEYLETQKLNDVDKTQWTALAMKRNPEFLFLWERARPLTKKASFSKFEPKSGFNSSKLSTTENRSVLSREQLLQIIYQHLHFKRYRETLRFLQEETGIKYNGFYNKVQTSILSQLIAMGVSDESKIKELPSDTKSYDLEKDTEVQMGSIYTHLDLEYDPMDIRNKLWSEYKSNDDTNVEYKKDGSLFGGSLNKLIEFLLIKDVKILDTFLLTYRSFTTPEILLLKLIECYQSPKDSPDPLLSNEQWEQTVEFVKDSVGKTLLRWVSLFFKLDFNQNMIRNLTMFIDDYFSKDNAVFANKLLNTVKKEIKSEEGETKVTSNEETDKKIAFPIVPKNIFQDTLSLGDIDELEIARQLTLMDHSLYSSIKPIELLNNAWSNVKLKHRASNVLKSSFRFNQISKWIVSFVVRPESLKQRRLNWIKGLNLVKHLGKFNNFNSLLAVSSGLQNASVHRLKHTQEGTDPKLLQEFESLTNLMSSDKAFKNYRAHMSSTNPPLVPYIGIYLTDLTFIEDGNPDYIVHSTTGKKLINWAKRKMVYEVISKIQEYQTKTYEFVPVYQVQQIIEAALNENFLTDNQVYDLSKKREPVDSQKSEIVQ